MVPSMDGTHVTTTAFGGLPMCRDTVERHEAEARWRWDPSAPPRTRTLPCYATATVAVKNLPRPRLRAAPSRPHVGISAEATGGDTMATWRRLRYFRDGDVEAVRLRPLLLTVHDHGDMDATRAWDTADGGLDRPQAEACVALSRALELTTDPGPPPGAVGTITQLSDCTVAGRICELCMYRHAIHV